jgi:hypothetical protein
MIDDIFALLTSISPLLPPIVRIAVVLLALLALWVLLSIPAYWLLRILDPFLTRGVDYLRETARAAFDATGNLLKRSSQPIEDFVETHAQVFSFARENAQIIREIRLLRQPVEAMPVKVASIEVRLTDASEKFKSATEAIQNMQRPTALAPPGPEEFTLVQKGRNRALITLIISLVILPPLVMFNTGMLNEFLSSWFVGLEYFNLPLSLILSGFMTIIEIALGALLVIFSNRLAHIILYSGIVFLAFVELSFYARLGQGFDWSIFDAFYEAGQAPAYTKLWFGVFGPVLVIGLAFVGHALFESVAKLADQHVVRQWRSHLKHRIKSASDLRRKLDDADRTRTTLNGTLGELQQTLDASQGNTQSWLVVMQTSKNDLIAQMDRAAAVRLEDTKRLDRGAMIRVFLESIFFAATIMLALVPIAFAYHSTTIFSPFLISSGLWLGWAVALAQAVLLLGAGSAASRSNDTLPSPVGGIPSRPAPIRFGLYLGVAILILLLACNAAYMLRAPTLLNFVWFALMAAGNVWLFWCGTRLGIIGAALWSLVRVVCYQAAAMLTAVFGALLSLASVLLVFLSVLLHMVSYPFRGVLMRDRRAGHAPQGAAT